MCIEFSDNLLAFCIYVNMLLRFTVMFGGKGTGIELGTKVPTRYFFVGF